MMNQGIGYMTLKNDFGLPLQVASGNFPIEPLQEK